MMNPVDLNIQDIYIGYIWVLNQVVELQVGVEGVPLGVEGDVTTVGYFFAACGPSARPTPSAPLWTTYSASVPPTTDYICPLLPCSTTLYH